MLLNILLIGIFVPLVCSAVTHEEINNGFNKLNSNEKSKITEVSTRVEIGGKQYVISEGDAVNAYMADMRCYSMGMQLVSLETLNKSREIVAWLRDNIESEGGLWTSGTLMQVDWTVWIWASLGTAFDDSQLDWASGQPNLDIGPVTCVLVDGQLGGWNDESCSDEYGYICETV